MKELHHIIVEDKKVMIEVIRERRRSVRFSVVKNGVNMRIPFILTQDQVAAQLENVKTWLIGLNKKKVNFLDKFEPKIYKTGDILTVGNKKYFLDIYIEDKKSHSARLKNNVITLRLSQEDSEEHRNKSISQLLSRVVANDFLPTIIRRVQELNHLYFRKNINEIRLKYNHSNWGSCSNNGIINLSTRLLFAPDDVIDYVIIHELSHLVEMNHSDRFWRVVETAMPDYREKEKWLSQNGNNCNF